MPFEKYFFLGKAFWDLFFPGEGPPRFFFLDFLWASPRSLMVIPLRKCNFVVMGFGTKLLWQYHTFVMKCTLNALCLLIQGKKWIEEKILSKMHHQGYIYNFCGASQYIKRHIILCSLQVLIESVMHDCHRLSVAWALFQTGNTTESCSNGARNMHDHWGDHQVVSHIVVSHF